MRTFAHFNPRTVEEAAMVLQRYDGKAKVIAGGTDILGKMKDEVLPVYPEALVNIKNINGLDFIETTADGLSIGALTRLQDIADSTLIKKSYQALAQGAAKTASPHLRAMGTIGGNISQDIRCWYYRNPNNRFPCLRKGGGRCYAIEGDNRFHSIFGGSVEKGCYAVHPSDTAPALIALNGSIVTTKRTIKAEDFFAVSVRKTTILEPDEIIMRIAVPSPKTGSRSAFLKFALRKSIDFPIVNCAASVTTSRGVVESARICLNAVFVIPYQPRAAEEYMVGKTLTEENAQAAADLAVANSKPMSRNSYMVQIAKTMVKRTLLACA
jgi:xanthine dehydrogenase YagS FAD-binding subunit